MIQKLNNKCEMVYRQKLNDIVGIVMLSRNTLNTRIMMLGGHVTILLNYTKQKVNSDNF